MTVNGGDWWLSISTGMRPIRSTLWLSRKLAFKREREKTVRVESQKPVLFLLIGRNIDERGRPLNVVHIFQFLQEYLNFLPIGRALRD